MRVLWWAPALLLLTGCVSAPRTLLPQHAPDIGGVPDAVPRNEPRSPLGNPPFYEVYGQRYIVLPSAVGYRERGVASWYGTQFHGLRTATGEPYDMFAMTAAHKTLPLPCYARVTNLANGRSVVVRINDRGPFVGNRIIDLSYTAAAKLDMLRAGTAFVQVEALTPWAAPLSVSVPAATPAGSLASTGVSSVPALSASELQALPPSAPITSAAARAAASAPLTTSGQLYLQVGAFAQATHAEQAAQQLRAAGISPVFVLGPSPQQPLLRVRVGPIATVQQFDSLSARLRTLGFPGARLAQD